MKSLINPSILLPVGILVLQSYLVIVMWIFLLKRSGIVQMPLGGMEYSQALFGGSILLGVLLITISGVGGNFQVYKVLLAQEDGLVMPFIIKSTQFYLVILSCQFLFGFLVWAILFGMKGYGKGLQEIKEGNLPFAILLGVVTLGSSLILKALSENLINMAVPRILTFS